MLLLALAPGRGTKKAGLLAKARLKFRAKRDRYVPIDCVVCSVPRSSLTAGPIVEETAARNR